MTWLRRNRLSDGGAPDEHGSRNERLTRLYGDRVAEQDRAHAGYAQAWWLFASELLKHGGTHVVPPLKPDPLLDTIRTEGRLTIGSAELREGDPSECHSNAVAVWRSGDAPAIGTGYALSDDGLWREHSWSVRTDEGIIETTEPRLKYFGIKMEGDRAEWFAKWIEGD